MLLLADCMVREKYACICNIPNSNTVSLLPADFMLNNK